MKTVWSQRMGTASLIAASLLRDKLQTLLTLVSFAGAFFVFGLLTTVAEAFDQQTDVAEVNRLIVVNRTSMTQPLPISYRDYLAQIDGVEAVTFSVWFGGIYQDVKNFFPKFAVDANGQRQVYPEFLLNPDQWQAFLADPAGIIVGRKTARRFGWKLGDSIPIKGTDYPGWWLFNLRGIYGSTRSADETQLWLHYEFLNQQRLFAKSTVGWYALRLKRSDDASRISELIDHKFENSPYETRTETEKTFITAFAKQAGDIEGFVMWLGPATLFALLLVSITAIALKMRLRLREVAILRTLGYSEWRVFLLGLHEWLLPSLVGTAVGLVLVALYLSNSDPTQGVFGALSLSTGCISTAFAITICIVAMASGIPALVLLRIPLVKMLRNS